MNTYLVMSMSFMSFVIIHLFIVILDVVSVQHILQTRLGEYVLNKRDLCLTGQSVTPKQLHIPVCSVLAVVGDVDTFCIYNQRRQQIMLITWSQTENVCSTSPTRSFLVSTKTKPLQDRHISQLNVNIRSSRRNQPFGWLKFQQIQ